MDYLKTKHKNTSQHERSCWKCLNLLKCLTSFILDCLCDKHFISACCPSSGERSRVGTTSPQRVVRWARYSFILTVKLL